MAGKIFINYRRDDSGGSAGRLHDRLAQTFGRKNLFMDVDNIPAGVDFVEYLPSQVAACDVFLAIIGPNWLDAKDGDGRRRFDNPDDFVTVEIAAALARNIRVIPVLVDGARTPKADKLPDSIKPLVRRNAVEVRNTNFGRDAEALASKVREALKDAPAVPRRWPLMTSAAAWLVARRQRRTAAGSAMALLLVGWIGLYQMGVPVWTPRAEQPDAPRADKAQTAVDPEAKRKAQEKEQQPTPPLGAPVPAAVALNSEAEQQQLAAAAAEAKRKSEEAERQRQATALVSQSSTALNNGDNDKAIATASEAIRLNPDDAVALTNRAVAYARKGDYDRALPDYDKAIRRAPNYARAFNDRGALYARKGDYDRAIADYNEAIRLDPRYARALCNRGRAKLKINDASGNADIAKAGELNNSCQ
jgi:tetratricopeptide (TPR) repeat protein